MIFNADFQLTIKVRRQSRCSQFAVKTLKFYTVSCDVHQRPDELRADVRPAGREGGRDVALLPRDQDREPRADWSLRGARTHIGGALGDPDLPHQLQPRMPEADCEPEPKRGAAM